MSVAPQTAEKRVIYVDCTNTYDFPKVRTGIQRVVRNLIKECENLKPNDFVVVPVAIRGSSFYRVPTFNLQIDSETYSLVGEKSSNSFSGVRPYLYRLAYRVISATGFVKILKAILFGNSKHAIKLKLLASTLFRNNPSYPVGTLIEFCETDIVVFLDSTWFVDVKRVFDNIPSGVMKVAVVYDLIPITHKQYCDETISAAYSVWLLEALKRCDAFLCISNTVRNDLIGFANSMGFRKILVDSFYLGSNMDLKSRFVVNAKPVFEGMLNANEKNFLVVGTVEPRKRVDFVLKAFEIARSVDQSVNLWIVGRVGWKVDELVLNIKSHPSFGVKLHFIENADDELLEYLYSRCTALIQSSEVEGFGLPLIEALERGLPVLASDIPIFREILNGCDAVHFFNLQRVDQLVTLLLGEEPKRPINFRWLSWAESSRIFFEKVIELEGTARRIRDH